MDVFYLIKEYWFNDATYDPLALNVLLDFKDWDLHTILVAEKLVNLPQIFYS